MNEHDRQERQKQRVAERAVMLVEDGMRLGLGSGTTAELFVRALAPRVHGGLRVEMVSSSERTERLASELGLAVVALDGPLDLAIDGADAVEISSLATIKGRGGALTREKIVAAAASRFVLVADSSKVVRRLNDVVGTIPIPVEVLPFGWRTTAARLERFGQPVPRVRDGEPFVTDNGNLILDLQMDSISDPAAAAQSIRSVTGVVEHGLFLDMASVALVGTNDGVDELWRASGDT